MCTGGGRNRPFRPLIPGYTKELPSWQTFKSDSLTDSIEPEDFSLVMKSLSLNGFPGSENFQGSDKLLHFFDKQTVESSEIQHNYEPFRRNEEIDFKHGSANKLLT